MASKNVSLDSAVSDPPRRPHPLFESVEFKQFMSGPCLDSNLRGLKSILKTFQSPINIEIIESQLPHFFTINNQAALNIFRYEISRVKISLSSSSQLPKL